MQMTRSRAQPIKCEYFWRLANQESVILPSLERKLRKNALCLNQSAISNFALYVISRQNSSKIKEFATCVHTLLYPASLLCSFQYLNKKHLKAEFLTFLKITIYFFLKHFSGPESGILEFDWLLTRVPPVQFFPIRTPRTDRSNPRENLK